MKRRRQFSLVLLVLLGAPGQLWAQTRALTLPEALAIAARQNPVLAAAGVEIRIAAAASERARGLDDFLLDAKASWLTTRRNLVAGTPVQEPASDEGSGALELRKPLPTGGQLGLHLLGDYSRKQFATELDSMMALARSTAKAYAPTLQLSFQHPLLRGIGVDVARADRRRAGTQGDLARAQRDGTAAALARDVVVAYWDLAYATRELEIRRSAATSAREQLRRVQANISVGKQPRSGAAEIEVAIALRDDAVLTAELALHDRALELARLCGLPLQVSGAPMLKASDVPTTLPGAIDGKAALKAALDRNPQLQAVRAQGRSAGIEIDVTENGLLPQLDFAVAGGPVANARTAGDAYSELKGLDSYSVMATLTFSQPLGRHAARGARDAAQEVLHKARLAEADIAAQVTAAVAHGVAAVESARRRAEVLDQSTDAAALDLEAEKARFEVGRSANFDVLRRQDALAAVQLVLLRARTDQLKAVAALAAATGDILTRKDASRP